MLIFGLSWDKINLNNIADDLAYLYQNFIVECDHFEDFVAIINENAIGYVISNSCHSNILTNVPDINILECLALEICNFFEDNFDLNLSLENFGLIFINTVEVI